jgi:Na+-transporting NADH:ubiquinone oxidoreductase subunit NqrA
MPRLFVCSVHLSFPDATLLTVQAASVISGCHAADCAGCICHFIADVFASFSTKQNNETAVFSGCHAADCAGCICHFIADVFASFSTKQTPK